MIKRIAKFTVQDLNSDEKSDPKYESHITNEMKNRKKIIINLERENYVSEQYF
jgi:hypothetical protein